MRFETLGFVFVNKEAQTRKLRMNQYLTTNEFIDFALEPSGSVMRFFIGTNSAHNVEINNTNILMRRETQFTTGLKTNSIDTYDNSNVVFQRNGVQVMKLNSLNDVELTKDIYLNGFNKYVKWTNCFIREGSTSTRPDFDFFL